MTILFALGLIVVVVFVAGPAAASSTTPKKTTTTTKTTTTDKTTTTPLAPTPGTDPNSPASKFSVINGTANAASDHEIVGTSAFPNYATGAVDNYYSMSHAHVDNAPFAEGTASPADTGPVGQTAAAGNFQQPQYADARWPGNSGTATYGTQGQPYAAAQASDYSATANASEATSGLGAPTPTSEMAVPVGFNGRLRRALAAWKAKWQGRLKPKTPRSAVTTPTATVPTPVATVTTPGITVGGSTPPVTVPSASVPGLAPKTASSRSLQSGTGDGASLLESSTQVELDPKTNALVTSGDSSLGRVSIGGGQIVLEGIHVSASITNDGVTPTDKVAVTVASATVGGVPVTIDQDGVHVAGQSQSLPYQEASDALNGALQQAGIQLFIVSPEINSGCSGGSSGGGTGTTTSTDEGTTTDSTTTTSTTPGLPGTTTTSSSDGTCAPSGTGSSDGSCTPTTTSSGTTTGTTTTTPTPTTPGLPGATTTTGTTTTTDSGGGTCAPSTTDSSGSCTTTTTNTPTTTDSGGTTDTDTTDTSTSGGSNGYFGISNSGPSSGEVTITATGVHVLFTQPIDESGVPAQNVEHILGEVFLDSLADPTGPPPNLDLNSNSGSGSGFSPSSCGGTGKHSVKIAKVAGASVGGGLSSGGSTSSGSSPSGSGSSFSQPGSSATGGTSQPISSSTGTGVPTSGSGLVSALRKPVWLLLAYLVWQALVIGTGASLWRWRRGGAS